MRKLMLVGVLAVAGCTTWTVPMIQEFKPFLTMELRGDPKTSAKCIVQFVDELGWQATVRDYGKEVQIIWHVGNNAAPFVVFTITETGAQRSKLEARTRGEIGPESKTPDTLREKFARCQ